MKLITITISKSYIWDEVQKNTEYVASKLISEVDVYDSIRISEDDMVTLERLYSDTIALLCGIFGEMYRRHDTDGDNTTFLLAVANAWREELKEALDKIILEVAISSMTGKWLAYSNQDEAAKYQEKTKAFIIKLKENVYSRKRPIPPTNKEN